MVDQLNAFASEVTRVAREVGTEANWAGRRWCRASGARWKDLTDSVNLMANNLTGQVRNIADVTTAVARGRFVPQDHGGRARRILELKNTINTMVDQLTGLRPK